MDVDSNRSFLDMEILKSFLCAAFLMGIHVTKPLMLVIQDNDTTQSNLKIFQDLYGDLLSTPAENYLQTNKCAETFDDQEIFDDQPVCKEFCCSKLFHNKKELYLDLFGFGPDAEKYN